METDPKPWTPAEAQRLLDDAPVHSTKVVDPSTGLQQSLDFDDFVTDEDLERARHAAADTIFYYVPWYLSRFLWIVDVVRFFRLISEPTAVRLICWALARWIRDHKEPRK